MSDTEKDKKFNLVKDYVSKMLRKKIGDLSDDEKTRKNISVAAMGVIKDVLKASLCEEIIPTLEITDVHKDCLADHNDDSPVDPTIVHVTISCKLPPSFVAENGSPPDIDMKKYEEDILKEYGF